MLVRSPRMGLSFGIKPGKNDTPYEQCVVNDVHSCLPVQGIHFSIVIEERPAYESRCEEVSCDYAN
jgi:hypothetical protein